MFINVPQIKNMKIKNLFVAFAVFGGLFLSGCQKEFAVETIISKRDSANVPCTAGDSVYLSRYFLINTYTYADTSYIANFLYDNLKRVKIVLDSSREPGINAPYDFGKTEYFYNGSDSLPNK